jgi:hypothetical protein
MWRSLLSVTLCLIMLTTPISAMPAADLKAPAEQFSQYLPVIATPALPVEVVVTARGVIDGYPSYVWVYGYVRNLTSTPLYSVSLDIEVTWYPYDPDGSLQPYTERAPLIPALPATLPGQINPFAYSLTLGKASAVLGEVRAISTSSSGMGGVVYYSLALASLAHDGLNLRGTLRNDSGKPLYAARVVVAEQSNTTCAWVQPQLATTALQPGQALDFHIDNYYQYCHGDGVVAIGQAAER